MLKRQHWILPKIDGIKDLFTRFILWTDWWRVPGRGWKALCFLIHSSLCDVDRYPSRIPRWRWRYIRPYSICWRYMLRLWREFNSNSDVVLHWVWKLRWSHWFRERGWFWSYSRWESVLFRVRAFCMRFKCEFWRCITSFSVWRNKHIISGSIVYMEH